jgi:ABC-type oligopeptide transport system substrate-binding subunit
MTKRIVALILVAVCLCCSLVSCHDSNIDGEIVKGAQIKMYLSEMVYDLDPAMALNNDSTLQVCGLIFDTLFVLDEDGDVVESLAADYEIKRDEKNNEYTMYIELQEDNYWSDGTYVSAEDVVYAWKRILNPEFNSEAACLLYDIKNAREAKAGDVSIDSVGISADNMTVIIEFVGDIDYDRFLRNLTSVALAPMREDVVKKNPDWSKKASTIICSGPFKIRTLNYGFLGIGDVATRDDSLRELVLERNLYFRRAKDEKYIDTSVTPYQLIIDYSLTKEQQLEKFAQGEIFYVGDIALSKRAEYVDKATVTDLMSTHSYYLNQKAEVAKADGTTEKLFANKDVRLALSKAIDRNAIAQAIVFAKAADALVPYGVFNNGESDELFRTIGGALISTSADVAAAKAQLSQAGITPANYTFAISVRPDDEVELKIAEMVCESWKSLGFNVSVKPLENEVNKDKYLGIVNKDIYDDTLVENFYNGDYDVIAVDLQAFSPDAFSVLAPFATGFSGQGQDMSAAQYIDVPHKTGYSNADYNALVEQIYKEADGAKRAELLHQAESMLLGDMPVIPIIFNQKAHLISEDLSKVEYTYYGYCIFTKTKQKDYMKYIETAAAN